MKTRLLLFIAVLVSTSPLLNAHEITTTKNPTGTDVVSEFNCRDRIYVLTRWDALSPGPHVMTLAWVNPQGQTQEETKVDVVPSAAASWGWLELDGAGAPGLMKAISPERGFEEYVGQWTANVYLDGKFLGSTHFKINC